MTRPTQARMTFTAVDMRVALQRYFGGQEWALAFEVPDATGGQHTGIADAVAFNLWPSRGLAIHGVEIKVSRGDWQRELGKPGKAETFHALCNYWWLAVAPGVLAKGLDEVPPGWGLLELRPGRAMDLMATAPETAVVVEPELRLLRPAQFCKRPDDLPRPFAAALARAYCKGDAEVVERRVSSAVENRVKARLESMSRERAYTDTKAARRLKTLETAFQEVGGLQWIEDTVLCRAVAMVLRAGVANPFSGVESLVGRIRRLGEEADGMASRLEEAIRIAGLPPPAPKAEPELFDVTRRRGR